MLRGYRIASKPEDFSQLFVFRKVLSAAKLLGWIVVCFLQSAGRFWFAKVHKFFGIGTPCRSTYCILCLFSTETFCRSLVVFWEVKTSILFDLSYYTSTISLLFIFLFPVCQQPVPWTTKLYTYIYVYILRKVK